MRMGRFDFAQRGTLPRPSHPSTGSGQAWEGGWLRDGFGGFPFGNGIFWLPSLCYTLTKHNGHRTDP